MDAADLPEDCCDPVLPEIFAERRLLERARELSAADRLHPTRGSLCARWPKGPLPSVRKEEPPIFFGRFFNNSFLSVQHVSTFRDIDSTSQNRLEYHDLITILLEQS